MRRKKIPQRPLSDFCKLEVDCRDGRKDLVLLRSDAKKLFDTGVISYNETNRMYCVPVINVVPTEVQPFVQRAKAELGDRYVWK